MSAREMLTRALRPVAARIRTLVSRGQVTFVDEAGAPHQRVQVNLGEADVHDEVRHLQPSGFATFPRAGAEAVVLFPGGSRERGLAIAVADRRQRLELEAAGEVAIYNPDVGSSVTLKADGRIHVEGDLVVEGNVSAAGDVRDGASSLQEFRDIYDIHTHATSSGPTGPPNPPSGGSATPPGESFFGRGTAFFDVAAGFMYLTFGSDGNWFAVRNGGGPDEVTAPSLDGPLPTDLSALRDLSYA